MRTENDLLKELASGTVKTPLPAVRKANLEAQLEAVAPGALAELNQAKVDEVLAESAGQEDDEG